MNKTFTLLAILLFSVGSLFAQHQKQDSTPNMRHNRTNSFSYPRSGYSHPRAAAPRQKKDGVYDRWYKEHKPLTKTVEAVYEDPSVERDGQGLIKENGSARRSDMKQSDHSNRRPGHLTDHKSRGKNK